MEITIQIFWVILGLFILSTILEHLINWGYRDNMTKNTDLAGLIIIHIIKWAILISVIFNLLKL